MKRFGVLVAALGGALIFTSSAFAHAELSPAVALAKHLQLFTLAVPTEKENASTTKVEFTPPSGFGIDSFVPAPGWSRNVKSTGSGESSGGSMERSRKGDTSRTFSIVWPTTRGRSACR